MAETSKKWRYDQQIYRTNQKESQVFIRYVNSSCLGSRNKTSPMFCSEKTPELYSESLPVLLDVHRGRCLKSLGSVDGCWWSCHDFINSKSSIHTAPYCSYSEYWSSRLALSFARQSSKHHPQPKKNPFRNVFAHHGCFTEISFPRRNKRANRFRMALGLRVKDPLEKRVKKGSVLLYIVICWGPSLNFVVKLLILWNHPIFGQIPGNKRTRLTHSHRVTYYGKSLSHANS